MKCFTPVYKCLVGFPWLPLPRLVSSAPFCKNTGLKGSASQILSPNVPIYNQVEPLFQEVTFSVFSPWDTAADEPGDLAKRMGRPCLVQCILRPAMDIPFLVKGKVLETSMALADHHLIP
jgi:hypothetical protein